jgi:hypothetical protein
LPCGLLEVRTNSRGFARFLRRHGRHLLAFGNRRIAAVAEVHCVPEARWPSVVPQGVVRTSAASPELGFDSLLRGDALYAWQQPSLLGILTAQSRPQIRVVATGASPERWTKLVAQRGSGQTRTLPRLPRVLNYGKALDLVLCLVGRLCGFAVLHGAVMEHAGRAVYLAGESGSGKSTAALALYRGGFRLLTDEYALLWTRGADRGRFGGILVPPMLVGTPPGALADLEHSLGRGRSGGKWRFPLSKVAGSSQSFPPAAILALTRPSNRPRTHRAERMCATQVIPLLLTQLLDPVRSGRAATVSTLADLADNVPAFRLTASRDLAALPGFVKDLMLAEPNGSASTP